MTLGGIRNALLLVAIFVIGPFSFGQTKPLCIVVAGDCRADYPWNKKRPGDNKEGINEKALREIAAAIAKDEADPQIMLWTGDMANVSEFADSAGPSAADKTKFLENGLNKWREIMDGCFKDKITKVTILPVRGNHEVEWYEEKDWSPSEIVDATKIWNQVFHLPSDIPQSDQADQGTTFAYAYGPVLCLGLDEYENRRHQINQQWLEGVLQKYKRPFIFAFAHEPAFATGGNHERDETLAAYPQHRDQMLETLHAAGARVFLCGHDHFYDHKLVRKSWTPSGTEMHQIAAGTAGAPNYKHKPSYPPDGDWQLEQVNKLDGTYGYVRIIIEENTAPREDTATIAFMALQADGQYKPFDQFKYSVRIP